MAKGIIKILVVAMLLLLINTVSGFEIDEEFQMERTCQRRMISMVNIAFEVYNSIRRFQLFTFIGRIFLFGSRVFDFFRYC
ncbi:unnamed protein product [Moneuplotes crassus]|uniref:Transmembrane protein n=1 Tax=Euplotes crassus TaxID=5936 RepID=A0AAD1Y3U0_EUPCR|nr:unnamed protein product [Moneuplotes crassus]